MKPKRFEDCAPLVSQSEDIRSFIKFAAPEIRQLRNAARNFDGTYCPNVIRDFLNSLRADYEETAGLKVIRDEHGVLQDLIEPTPHVFFTRWMNGKSTVSKVPVGSPPWRWSVSLFINILTRAGGSRSRAELIEETDL